MYIRLAVFIAKKFKIERVQSPRTLPTNFWAKCTKIPHINPQFINLHQEPVF